ncbi:MAG: HEAT repeat domain-containing protein [Phycisphaeraceae bacterium]|nr:HEAT repeat domain-containing protein [Phycisphaeraceae bacterium]
MIGIRARVMVIGLVSGLAMGCAGGPGGGGGASPGPVVDAQGGEGLALSKSQMRERAIGVLSELAFDSEPEVRANAIEALQAVPTRVEPIVRASLQDSNVGVRYAAAMTVGQLQLRDTTALVRPLLDDPSVVVRCAAIFALHRNGVRHDLTPIADMLNGRDFSSASMGAFMLGELGDASAAPMLRSAAKRSHFDHPDARNMQLSIAEALYKLGDPAAGDVIRAAIYPNTVQGFEQAALAAQIIGEVGDESAVAQLIRIVERTRSGAAQATGPDDYLYPAELRLAASAALARLGYPDGWYVGERYRTDPSPALRAQAAHTLGRTGLGRDVAALNGMLGDPDKRVRVAAAGGILNAIERPTRPKPRGG